MVRALPVLFLMIAVFFSGQAATAQAQGTGALSITTTPVRGAIYIDRVLRSTSFWSGDLAAGSHVVSFGNVDGYIAPPPQMVTVIADQTYSVVGTYRKLFSLLRPIPLPPSIAPIDLAGEWRLYMASRHSFGLSESGKSFNGLIGCYLGCGASRLFRRLSG
jgi:hypothetical protein